MSVTINPPKTPVTAGSNGVAAATLPNVCKMPGPPAPFVPTPLPNVGKSGNSPKDYSKDVTIEGNAVAIRGATFKSTGDVASQGTGGGLISSNVEGPTSFVGPGSMDVKIEGKNVQLLSDPMLNNGGPSGTPANAGTMIGIIQASGLVIAVDEVCPICGEHHGKLEETPKTKADAGRLAEAFDTRVRAVDGKTKTMLGVVSCPCNKNYADQSGTTTAELRGAADKLGMVYPEGAERSVTARPANSKRRGESTNNVKLRMEARLGKTISLCDQTTVAFEEKWEEWTFLATSSRQDPSRGAAYPPGSCAAQKVLLLLSEDGALPKAMTEQWYSSAGTPTASPIAFIDARENRSVRKVLPFPHGETVPPCRTCEAILPFLMCPGEKAECLHQKK
jgi:hypothetical protein